MEKLLILIFSLSLLAGGTDQVQLPKYAQKKIDKQLEDVYENKSVDLQKVDLSKAPKENRVGTELYKITSDKKLVGYLYLDDAPSKFEHFNYSVIFKPDLTIANVKLLIYREDYGGEIGSRRWLSQFEGKSSGKNMEYQDDIAAISGATISCKSITLNIKEISTNLAALKKAGII